MKNFLILITILFCLILGFSSCTYDNQIIKVISGNTVLLSSGEELHLTKVKDCRSNYDYLSKNYLFKDVIVIKDSENIVSYIKTIYGSAYNNNTCINKLLEQDTIPNSVTSDTISSIPNAPKDSLENPVEIYPTVSDNVTEPTLTDSNVQNELPTSSSISFSDEEWKKPDIKSTKDVSEIYSFIINVFKTHNITYMPHIPVKIISGREMKNKSRSSRTIGLAYTTTFPDGEQAFEIYIISGLSRMEFADVLAHEIMHTWINQNHIKIKKSADEEGLCNYASYITLKYISNNQSSQLISEMMSNPDPIYGAGFRNVKRKIDKIGLDNYLSILKGEKESSDFLLEMPKLKESDLIINHRGYVVSYNTQYKIPNWVAYELTKAEAKGTYKRSNNFQSDPETSVIQAEDSDYSGSGWQRGHLAPAGDMKWGKQIMNESFYYTNIAPQYGPLNNGYWKRVEEGCRNLAQQYGSIYIVSGCVVEENKYGTIGFNKVYIPDFYYKVLLVKNSQNYKGVGFVFRNSENNMDFEKYMYSIDTVESITGNDFFYHLDDNIEDIVEGEYDSSFWSVL